MPSNSSTQKKSRKQAAPSPREQARIYLDAGLRVMPIAMPAKEPAVAPGFYARDLPEACAEPEQFRDDHQVGILCGRVRHREDKALCGLDRDGDATWGMLEELFGCALPSTLTSKGDRHRFYWIPTGLEVNQCNGILRCDGGAIDTRPHAGGYFREPWEWDGGFDIDRIAELPDDAVEALRELSGTKSEAVCDPAAFGPHERELDLSALKPHLAPAGHDDSRHELVRALGGWAGKANFSSEALERAVGRLPTNQPGKRVQQARLAYERARRGLETPGWKYLEERFGADVANAFARANEDPWLAAVRKWWRSDERRNAKARRALQALPKWCRGHVEACCEELRTPLEVNLALALGALSSAVQGRVVVRMHDGWSEHTGLYVCVVDDPSGLKSPALRKAVEPIKQWEADTIKAKAPELQQAKLEREVLEKTSEDLKKSLKPYSGNSDPTDPLNRETNEAKRLIQVRTRLAEPPPVEFRYLAEDCTPERLVALLADHGRLAFITDEGSTIFGMLGGRYDQQQQANLSAWCKAYDGDSVRVDRVGRETTAPRHPYTTLSSTVATQPSVFCAAMRNPAFVGQGLVARFSWVVAPPTGPRWAEGEQAAPVPLKVLDRYAKRLRRMLGLRLQEVTLSPEAHAADVRWRDELERRLHGESADLTDLRGWVGKHRGRTARIAGILWAADGGKEPQITGEQYERAIELARWLLDCTAAALRTRNVEVVGAFEDKILQLVGEGVDKLGKLESRITAARRGDVQPALDRLVDGGDLILEGGHYRLADEKAA
jgi:hypothetical protein